MTFAMWLDWAGLAISLFDTISLLWLGLTILLNGNRRVVGTWLIGGGMLVGALFFTSHTAILGHGLLYASLGMDFWWWVSWGPAAAAPLAWYGAMLWYAGFRLGRPHRHRAWLVVVVTLAGATVLLLILANPLPSYHHVVGRVLVPTPTIGGVPVLILLYLGYSVLCYLLPLDLLRRAEAAAQPLLAAERRRARPWLIAVSALMLLAGLAMSGTALWVVGSDPPLTLADARTVLTVKLLDLVVAGMIALAITLLGRAIVAYAVFTGRPLPRHGFFRQWRSTVILAVVLSGIVSSALTIGLRPLYGLMLTTTVIVLFYALHNWQASVEREQFMARLRPFVASQGLYEQLRDTTPPDPVAPQQVFEALCRDVLAVHWAALVPTGALATLAGPRLVYAPGPAPLEIPSAAELTAWFSSPEVRYRPAEEYGAAWAVGLWSERGLGGVLLLGEKLNGSPYTEEEIEVAQAGSERLLDSLAGAEMARLAMGLLRQRIAQVRLMEGQGRRVLHDEILPQIHTAILGLGVSQEDAAARQAVEILTAAHHRLSNLMRDAGPPLPDQLAHGGWVQALGSQVEKRFSEHFTEIVWQFDPEALQQANQVPLFVGEVVYFAAQELIRNAARHGRGEQAQQPLRLTVALEKDPSLRLVIEDDGVGLDAAREYEALMDAGSGLRLHSTLLAAVGASMEVLPRPAGGTRAVITIPVEPGPPA